MKIQTILLLISFIVTVIFAIIIIPILKKVKIGQIEREDGPQSHLQKQGTPTMGGIIFMISITLCTIGTYIFYRIYGGIENINNLLPILFLTLGFGFVGLIDDFKKLILHNTKGLNPKAKMLGLLIISILYTLFIIINTNHGTSIVIPILKLTITLDKYLYIPFAIIVILATTNAINLTDGVDGLSSSVSSIIITTLTVIAIINSVNEIIIIGSITVRSNFRIFNV